MTILGVIEILFIFGELVRRFLQRSGGIRSVSVNRGVSIDVARKIDLASFYTKMKS
jgi:hypothetical protein